MPAANGAFASALQLPSAGNEDATTTLINPVAPFELGTANYLTVMSSGFAILKDCLSLFAVFIIVRYTLRQYSGFPRNSCPCTVRPSIWRQPSISLDATPRSTSKPALRVRNWYLGRYCGLLSRIQGRPGPVVQAPPRPPPPPPHFFSSDMDEKNGNTDSGRLLKTRNSPQPAPDIGSAPSRKFSLLSPWTGQSEPSRRLISRPPPAPPLTPPDISSCVFTLDSLAATDSFIHQPNPDYMSLTSTTMTQNTSSIGKRPNNTRRRSYQKTLPIGIPHRSPLHESNATDLTVAANSYPPTSPLLPPPPPTDPEGVSEQEDGGRPDAEADLSHDGANVRGELVSVLDGEGAGWTRHTRVYGGGVCLACAAAGREGGFYGVNVRPEEMR